MSSELYQTIELIGREKGLETETIIQAIEEAYAAATRKYYRSKEDFGARFDKTTGVFEVFSKHTIVEEDDLADPQIEITIEDARKVQPEAELGQVLETPKGNLDAPLTRIAAQAAKQVIYQKVKEAERELIWHEYADRSSELLTGVVKRFDRGDMVLDLGRTEGVIPRREQSRAEHYNPGDRVRAVLIHVERQGKGPQLIMSRASELLVKKLFEMEVPEIYDSTVSIVNVARDAGERSKVAVQSKDRDVDPVGACVGMKGSRVQAVIRELRGEKIDIVQYDDDPTHYVRNALNPAAINRVGIREYETRDIEVIVAEDQLSLAIGRKGQNVRLASKLVGWNLDIKSEAEKKAEVEAEMERMARASHEMSMLPGVETAVGMRLLDAGFRTLEEVSLASMEDLTSIDGIDEETAIAIHDSAEVAAVELAEQRAREAEEAAAREAEEAAAREAEEAAALAAEAEADTDDEESDAAVSDSAVEGTEAEEEEEVTATDDAPVEASVEKPVDGPEPVEAATAEPTDEEAPEPTATETENTTEAATPEPEDAVKQKTD
jgi:N utilization substance protein A